MMTGDAIRPLRVAVIGCGKMANRVHYPSLASLPDIEIIAACDIDPARVAETANKWGIPGRYADYRRMLAECAPLDAVYAVGQPHQLFEVWLDCLQRGLNLFVEKPLGLTRHHAVLLAHLAEKHGCITQVGFQRRIAPLAVALRDRCVARGGPITHAVCQFYKCEPGKPYLTARDHMMDDGVHIVDTLRWACGGGEVVGIESVTARVGVPDINFIAALLRFDSGVTGAMLGSWSSGRRIFRVELHGEGVCAEFDPEGSGTLYADGDIVGEPFDTHAVSGSDELFVYGGFQAKSREFLDSVRAGTLPSSHFGDALKTMEIAERILARDFQQ